MTGRARRAAMAGAVGLVLLGLGVTACSGGDNGGVITGTTPSTTAPAAASSTTVSPTTLSGGTLPSS